MLPGDRGNQPGVPSQAPWVRPGASLPGRPPGASPSGRLWSGQGRPLPCRPGSGRGRPLPTMLEHTVNLLLGGIGNPHGQVMQLSAGRLRGWGMGFGSAGLALSDGLIKGKWQGDCEVTVDRELPPQHGTHQWNFLLQGLGRTPGLYAKEPYLNLFLSLSLHLAWTQQTVRPALPWGPPAPASRGSAVPPLSPLAPLTP